MAAGGRGSGGVGVRLKSSARMTEDGSLHTEGRKLDFGYPAAAATQSAAV